MFPTQIRRMPITTGGRSGVQPWRQPQRVEPYTYRSPYGPKYKVPFNIMGVDATKALRLGTLAGGFGAAAGIFALFFLDGVPRVQKDILQKVPGIAWFFTNEVPPEDNPF